MAAGVIEGVNNAGFAVHDDDGLTHVLPKDERARIRNLVHMCREKPRFPPKVTHL